MRRRRRRVTATKKRYAGAMKNDLLMDDAAREYNVLLCVCVNQHLPNEKTHAYLYILHQTIEKIMCVALCGGYNEDEYAIGIQLKKK